MPKRIKTDYPGVYYREARRLGAKGMEKIYYVTYKKDGKLFEEKVGRQFVNDMTPAKAATVRGELIEGKRESRKEKRIREAKEKAEAHGKWTINRLADAYFENRPDGKSKKTDQGRYVNYLKTPFGTKEPSEIIKLDLDRLRIKLLKKKKPQTVAHVLNLLGWVINNGYKSGLTPPLPFAIQKPTVNNIKTEDLTPDQLKALLEAIDKDVDIQAGNMMRLVLATGMRRGELFRLQWTDIDFDRGFIHLRDPKGKRDQTIPLNATSRSVLNDHPKTKDSAYIFPGLHGNKRVDVRKAVNRIKKAAGLPADFRALHGLRHAYASALASSGQVDLYTLQRLLTHKSPQMTTRYAHLSSEALQRGAGVVDDILNHALSTEKQKAIKEST